MDLLVSIYIFCVVVAELMGGKTFFIADIGGFHLNSSVSIFLLPIVFSINDIITEVYGKDRTRSLIRSSLIVIILIILFSLLATKLPASSRFLTNEKAYETIFNISIRFSLASLAAFALAEFTDVFIFSRIRERFGRDNLWLRNNVSNFIAQFIDTTTFMFLVFYILEKSFIDNLGFIFGLILPYWLLKCFMSVIDTPFVYLGTKWLKNCRKENI